jgi:putative flippase GtrA
MQDAGEELVRGISGLRRKQGLLRAAQFGVAGVIGFLTLEAVLLVGLYVVYGRADLSSGLYSSPSLLGLDVLASFVGVTVGFFVNERTTARGAPVLKTRGVWNMAVRLLKFQGVYVVGNAITIGVQLGLLGAFALSPVVGNIVGAIVAYPPSYLIAMRLVWRI